jgi:hypothetical protein
MNALPPTKWPIALTIAPLASAAQGPPTYPSSARNLA